jgi:hypothetical protein
MRETLRGKVRLDSAGAIPVDRYRDHREIGRARLCGEAFKGRQFVEASGAPTCPKVQNDDLSAKLAKGDAFAMSVCGFQVTEW